MTAEFEKNRSSTALEEALEWRARLDDDELTNAERLAFHSWLQRDHHHELILDYVDRFWDAADRIPTVLSTDELDRLQAPEASVVDRIPKRPLWFAAAAAVLLMAVFGLFSVGQQGVQHGPKQALELRTERGVITTFDLSDGSTIALGAASEVDVLMTDTKRQISMRKGDAFFDVASDASRPFVVKIDRLQVRVTGTAFDVRRGSAVTEVAVVEGVVVVSEERLDLSPSASAPKEENSKTLTAGHRVAFSDAQGFSNIQAVGRDRIGAWRRNRLVFQDAPIGEIVATLNRYLAEPVLVEGDEEVGGVTFSATVNTRDIEILLSTLEDVFPVKLQRRSDGARVLRPAPD